MAPSRHGTAAELLRFALLSVPSFLLRAALSPRPPRLSDFSDRDLADLGLSHADLEQSHERPGAAELKLRRAREGRNWR